MASHMTKGGNIMNVLYLTHCSDIEPPGRGLLELCDEKLPKNTEDQFNFIGCIGARSC